MCECIEGRGSIIKYYINVTSENVPDGRRVPERFEWTAKDDVQKMAAQI